MPERSSSSAGATYLNKPERIALVRDAALRAAKRLPSIRRVILFGSLVSGIPTPRSDADLLVVVEKSPHAHPRERTPEVLRALTPLPCPVDLFVLTQEELARLEDEGDPVVHAALTRGMELL